MIEAAQHECLNGWMLGLDAEGREVMRECPECRMARLARGGCGIPEHFRGMTWANWTRQPQLADQVAALRGWRGDPWGILLYSAAGDNFGRGKTLVLCLTVRDWRERGLLAYYLPVAVMIRREGERIGGERLSETGTSRWAETFGGVLALDDLGAEHQDTSGWNASLIETVLDARYAHDLPTLVAANLDLDGLGIRYPRAMSRLSEGLLLGWNTPRDFRPRRSGRQAIPHVTGGTGGTGVTRIDGKLAAAGE